MFQLGKAVIEKWDMVLMCIALGIVFAFEMMGVFVDRYVTITAICRTYVPLWGRAMILGWLVYHFTIAKGN
jgi:hypothetical protein